MKNNSDSAVVDFFYYHNINLYKTQFIWAYPSIVVPAKYRQHNNKQHTSLRLNVISKLDQKHSSNSGYMSRT